MHSNKIEQFMRDKNIVAVNIHRDGDVFRVHVRKDHEGFRTAQAAHQSVTSALREQIPATTSLAGLL